MTTSIYLLKTEPVSPLSNLEETSSSSSRSSPWVPDNDTFDWTTLDDDYDNIDDDQFINDNNEDDCESKAHVAAELLENLERLEDLDELIKEEPFMNWMEDKTIIIPTYHHHHQDEIRLIKNTQDTPIFLTEFENVFDVELNNTLTPPQSPPYATVPVLASLLPLNDDAKSSNGFAHQYAEELPNKIFVQDDEQQQQQQQQQQQYVVPQLEETTTADFKRIFMENSNSNYNISAQPQSDVDRELAVVDEIVRARAENFIPTSPSSSSLSSDDPDWSPDESKTTINSNTLKQKRSRSSRTRPYGTNGNEERKSRKKEQNKNAATRYRLKKKAEVEEILTEERQLQKESDDLENNINDIQREIKYIKGLMKDLFKAKGLI